jgi:hypothetical protein
LRHWAHHLKDNGIPDNDIKFANVLALENQTEYLRNNIYHYVSSLSPLTVLVSQLLHHPTRYPRKIWFMVKRFEDGLKTDPILYGSFGVI